MLKKIIGIAKHAPVTPKKQTKKAQVQRIKTNKASTEGKSQTKDITKETQPSVWTLTAPAAGATTTKRWGNLKEDFTSFGNKRIKVSTLNGAILIQWSHLYEL